MDYYILGLMYTYKCTGRCDICMLNCSPERKEKMPFEDAERLIYEAKECGLRIIAITGGEPFLYYHEIVKLVRLANSQDIPTSITTNCYWADSYEKTQQYLTTLQEAGTMSMKISLDDFHNKYVPFENIKNVMKVSKAIGLRVTVGCTITKNSMKLKGVLQSFGEEVTDIALYEHKCYPLGRAKEKIDKDEIYYSNNIKNVCQEKGLIFVLPNGEVYPCGSVCGFISNRLVGSIYESSLKELINEAVNNKHNIFIRKFGVKPYIEEIKKDCISIKIEKEFVDTCHACYEIFSKERIETLNKILERITRVALK